MKINEIIRNRRKELNLTQEQVADGLGVTAPAVHKWEKGISYPDITLLPTLARLLQIDLNTLFSFEQELTEQEVTSFSDKVIRIMQDEGFYAGYQMTMDKIKEFPNCALLLCSMAAVLDGTLILLAVEEAEKYTDTIERLYERAAELGDNNVRDQANNMLVLRYIRREEFDKAEGLLDTLPDTPVDKRSLKAAFYIRRKEMKKAVSVLEESLWFYANSARMTLISLMQCFQNMKEENLAELCVQKIREIVESLNLWDYSKYLAEYQMAIYRKDKERTLASLRLMLESMRNSDRKSDFPLYAEIPERNREGYAERLMCSGLAENIRKQGLGGEGFLQGDAELEALLAEFEVIDS
ncbi:helix-turn-helix domain-containing protein [Lachnospiraceae bacterium 46-15]